MGRERHQAVRPDEAEGAHRAGVIEGVEHLQLHQRLGDCEHHEHQHRHDRERHVRRLMPAVRLTREGRENPVPTHRQHDASTRIHAGERQGEEAGHRGGREGQREERHFAEISHHTQRRVDFVEGGRVAIGRQHFHVADEYEERPGQDQTPDDRFRNRFGRVLRLLAKGRRTFEANEAEDRDHHTEGPGSSRRIR